LVVKQACYKKLRNTGYHDFELQVQKELERAQAEERKLREVLDKAKKEDERKKEKVTVFEVIVCDKKRQVISGEVCLLKYI
jgi:hypothetical protein